MAKEGRAALVAVAVLLCAAACAPVSGSGGDVGGMTLLEAAVLGAVEGVTEYLPVSSTGHLLVTQRLLGIGTDGDASKTAADAFAICIQAGAIFAVLGLYRRRVGRMVLGVLGKDAGGARLFGCLLAAFVPAAVAGLTVGDLVKEHLFGAWPVVFAWAAGGVVILLVAGATRDATPESREGLPLEGLTWRLALVVGLLQCLAMWPGVSRSLVTIVGGVLVGLSLPAAVEFSFLLGLVTLGAATGYDAIRHGGLLLETYTPASMLAGLLAAFVTAVLAVRWLVSYLQSHGLELFGWYRIAIAVVVATLLGFGAL